MLACKPFRFLDEKNFCNLVFAEPNRELQNLTEKTDNLLHKLICSKIALQDHEYNITIPLFYRSLSFIFHILYKLLFRLSNIICPCSSNNRNAPSSFKIGQHSVSNALNLCALSERISSWKTVSTSRPSG